VISVVFGDLVGSTKLHEGLDAESVRRVMSRFYEVMRGAVARYGGRVEKFLGDGVVAVFGAPLVGEDDALRAVRCAAVMVEDLAVLAEELMGIWELRLQMRVGVDTGELVISPEGELVGDTMNTAARLEQAAEPGQVLIGEATWRLVRHGVQLEPVEPLLLRGKALPVRAWRLRAAVPGPDEPAGGRMEAPLVGRVAELGRLRAALDEAVSARACRLITVIGSPGVGKTRLSQEFVHALGAHASVVYGRCEPSGAGLTFGPVAEMLRRACGIREKDTPYTVRAKLAEPVYGDPDEERIVQWAAALLGAADPVSAEETFWAVRRIVEALAGRRPLILVLDDLHWGQPLFLDLVEHLVEWVRDAPTLVLILARPELRETREELTVPSGHPVEVIELAALDVAQSRALVEGALGRGELPPELLGRILDTAEGNPLFLLETLRMLVDEGSLTRDGDTWATAEAEIVRVPPTIHALLSARIERLPTDERTVVERAAVVGKQFYRGAVAQLVPPEVRAGIDGHLEHLQRKEMIEPDGSYFYDEPVYRFHNVLIRDAAYRSLLKADRAELHENFADWLAAKAGDPVAGEEEVIAYHLEQSLEYRRQLGPLDARARDLGTRSAARLHSAGQRALARADLAAATNLLRRADECTQGDDPELLWDLAGVLVSIGDTAAAREAVERLSTMAAQDQRLRPRAAVLSGELSILTGDPAPEVTLENLTQAADALTAAGDWAGSAKAHLVTSQGYTQLRQLGAAEAALDRALLAARRIGDARLITAVLAAAPRFAVNGPSPVVRGSGRCLDVLRILRMTPGNRHVEPIALRCQAVLEAMRGRFGPARDILAAGRATLEELGLAVERQKLATYAGVVELLAGDAIAAEAFLRPARDGFAAFGLDVSAARSAALLARALLEQRRDDEAFEHTRFAERYAGGDLKTVITWCGVRAEVLARRGDHEEALALARHGVTLGEPTDALPDKADATLALARVLRTIGRESEMRSAARAARALYEAKEHAVGATRATDLIGGHAHRPDGLARLGNRPPDRLLAEFISGWERGGVDAVIALYAGRCRLVDHRIAGGSELRGRDQARGWLEALMRTGRRIHPGISEILACDDRVIAFVGTWRGRDTDVVEDVGAVDLGMGWVVVVESGQVAVQHVYETHQREDILACYADVGGRPGVLGDRPPERAVAKLCRRWTVAALDELADVYTEDVVQIDHRALVSHEVHGRDGVREAYRSALSSSPRLRLEPDEVLACDDRVLALRVTLRGTGGEDGGEFATSFAFVVVAAGGRIQRVEQFEHFDTAGILARYTELTEPRERPQVRAPELLYTDFAQHWAAGGADAVLEVFADDYTMVDHRQRGFGEVRDRDDLAELIRSIFAAAPDLRVTIDDVIACDDRVVALRLTWHDETPVEGSPYAVTVGYVAVVESDRFARGDMYEPDDGQAMVARYAALGGGQSRLGDRPPERLWAECALRFAERDADALVELLAEDHVLVDRRPGGDEEVIGRDEVRPVLESAFAAATGRWLDVDEITACDERVIALSVSCRGARLDGGVPVEVGCGLVAVIDDHLFTRTDRYGHGDRLAMVARFAELGGGQGRLGDRPPERFWAEYARGFAERDVEALTRLVAADHVMVDHRLVPWEGMRKDEIRRRFLESIFAEGNGWWLEFGEVLACDERVIALLVTFHRIAVEGGGPVDVAYGLVTLIEDGLLSRTDRYEYSDRKAMLAQFAALAGESQVLGDRPPERLWKTLARRFAAGDLDELPELYADDWRLVDHRTVGWGVLAGGDQAQDLTRSILAISSDVRLDFTELLACDERVIAFTAYWRGSGTEGIGEIEVPMDIVSVVESGRMVLQEMYEPDQRDAMLARYAELADAPRPDQRPHASD
jgi:class 3 adenylate cyclase/ketosteroid isomerase-like protein/tetratricopeptide (TPR) repeat protein